MQLLWSHIIPQTLSLPGGPVLTQTESPALAPVANSAPQPDPHLFWSSTQQCVDPSFAFSPRLLAKGQGPKCTNCQTTTTALWQKPPVGTLAVAMPAASCYKLHQVPRALGASFLSFLPLPFLTLLPSPLVIFFPSSSTHPPLSPITPHPSPSLQLSSLYCLPPLPPSSLWPSAISTSALDQRVTHQPERLFQAQGPHSLRTPEDRKHQRCIKGTPLPRTSSLSLRSGWRGHPSRSPRGRMWS